MKVLTLSSHARSGVYHLCLSQQMLMMKDEEQVLMHHDLDLGLSRTNTSARSFYNNRCALAL